MTDSATFVLRPPRRETLTESIVESLREAIFAGVFGPGERVAERNLPSGWKSAEPRFARPWPCWSRKGSSAELRAERSWLG